MSLSKVASAAKFTLFSISLLCLAVTFLSLQLSFVWSAQDFQQWTQVTIREEQFRANWDAKTAGSYADAKFPGFVQNGTEWQTKASLSCSPSSCDDTVTTSCGMNSGACAGPALRTQMASFQQAHLAHKFGLERFNIERALFDLEAESFYINTILNVDDHFNGDSTAFSRRDGTISASIAFAKAQLAISNERRDAAARASASGNTAALFGQAAAVLVFLVWLALLTHYEAIPVKSFAVVGVSLCFLAGLAAVGLQDSVTTYAEQGACVYKSADFTRARIVADLTPGSVAPVEYSCKSEAEWVWGFWMIWIGWAGAFLGTIIIFAEPMLSGDKKEQKSTESAAPAGTAV